MMFFRMKRAGLLRTLFFVLLFVGLGPVFGHNLRELGTINFGSLILPIGGSFSVETEGSAPGRLNVQPISGQPGAVYDDSTVAQLVMEVSHHNHTTFFLEVTALPGAPQGLIIDSFEYSTSPWAVGTPIGSGVTVNSTGGNKTNVYIDAKLTIADDAVLGDSQIGVLVQLTAL